MRKFVSDVAAVVRDLETLNLIQKNNISTLVILDSDKQLVLQLKIKVDKFVAELCVKMFEKIKSQNNLSGNISVQELESFNREITVIFSQL